MRGQVQQRSVPDCDRRGISVTGVLKVCSIVLELGENERIDVPSVVARLCACVPSAQVTTADYFAALRKKHTEMVDRIAVAGLPLPQSDHVLRSIDRSEAEMGPGVGIAIQLQGGAVLEGYVWVRKVALSSRELIPAILIKPIEQFLVSLEIGTIQQHGFS